ncbi:MAG TPA: hypothetical protein VGX25_31000 [Actinophytocola sp.]|uniref:hypothetical protein n=1 Tax=Actinophytocola sp. TaxID=1872138 RepID=UPI002DDCFDCF|nr:hypothetical protein [Actinophytocola sp.]HEV2783836.1 hypothetical protein [Actinophytocola sp.]
MSIREVFSSATVTLDHRPYHVRTWRGGFVAAAEQGSATVLSGALEILDRVELGDDLVDVALADDGASWAWISGGELRIGSPDAPRSAAVTGEGACRWRSPARDLWFAASSGPEVAVEVWTGSAVHRALVPDPFGDSGTLLFDHPASDSMVLWIAAGRDGARSWLVSFDGVAVRTERLPCDDRGPALFGPAGDWFLAPGRDDLVRVSWPGGAVLGRLAWSPVGEHDLGGMDVQLLPGGYASWSGENGRICVVDLTTMAVADEIAIAGRPLGFSVAGADGTLLTVHDENRIELTRARDWSPEPDRYAAGSIA